MKFTREQIITGLKNGTIALEHKPGNVESKSMLKSLCTEAFTRDRAPSGTAKYYYKGVCLPRIGNWYAPHPGLIPRQSSLQLL